MSPLKAPFPYFGGKSKVADVVWSRLGGDVKNYIEPFCGSMAMLLHKDEPTNSEIVNDIDGLLTNFWRAIQFGHEEVAEIADVAPTEIDLKARNDWLYEHKEEITEKMKRDPEYFNAKAAAYWVYVRSTACGPRRLFQEKTNQIPQLDCSRGVQAKSRRGGLVEIFAQLNKRIRGVKVCCGDWTRVLTNSPLKLAATPTGVFLDPPYQEGEFDDDVYEHTDSVFSNVRQWCLEHGDDPELRIALCGYEGNEMPDEWTELVWKTRGGWGRKSGNKSQAYENRTRERIWFSPHCHDPTDIENTFIGQFM